MVNLTVIGKNSQIVCDSDTLDLIRDNFSVPNPAKRSGSNRFIPARLYVITPTGRFESGMLKKIISFLESERIQYTIDKKLNDLFDVGFKNVPDKLIGFNIYDYIYYQEEAIKTCLEQGRGVVLLPTAAGKTLTCAGLIENFKALKKKNDFFTIVIVPSIQLVEQTANDFIEYGIENVRKWSGKNSVDISERGVIVTNTQNLLSKNTDLSFLSDVDLIIIDEIHGVRKANSINDIFKFIKTENIFGFTGTLPVELIDQWNIIGRVGPILYEKKGYEIETNLSAFSVYILKFKAEKRTFKKNKDKPLEAYQNEVEYLVKNPRRNEVIKNLAIKLGTNTIVMVERIEHGEELERLIKNGTDKPVFFIHGNVDMEERERIRELMDKNNDIIIVAISKIFSTGINIPNLRNIIFASTGKAKIRIMQTIGRALRKHPTKSMAYIFDIADNTTYGSQHLQQRKLLYINEKYTVIEKDI